MPDARYYGHPVLRTTAIKDAHYYAGRPLLRTPAITDTDRRTPAIYHGIQNIDGTLIPTADMTKLIYFNQNCPFGTVASLTKLFAIIHIRRWDQCAVYILYSKISTNPGLLKIRHCHRFVAVVIQILIPYITDTRYYREKLRPRPN